MGISEEVQAMGAAYEAISQLPVEAQVRALGWLSDHLKSDWDKKPSQTQLEEAVRWALGENGEFPLSTLSDGKYYWRPELRERAGIDGKEKPDG